MGEYELYFYEKPPKAPGPTFTLGPKALRVLMYPEDEILRYCLEASIEYKLPGPEEFAPNFAVRAMHARRAGKPIEISTKLNGIRYTWRQGGNEVLILPDLKF